MIAGGVVAAALQAGALPRRRERRPAGGAHRLRLPRPLGPRSLWLPRVLAAVVILYALQTLYSDDFSKGLQNVCFFLVPFAIAFALLAEVRWDRRLLRSPSSCWSRRGGAPSS